MKSVINGLAVGLGRKIAFEIINDTKKEHDVKLIPRSTKAFKETVSFKLGSSFSTSHSRLLQILDSIQSEYMTNQGKVEELQKYLRFVESKLPFLEHQIVTNNHRNQFESINNLFANILNIINNGQN